MAKDDEKKEPEKVKADEKKEPEKAKADEKKEPEKAKANDGLITAVYRMNLHCPQCAQDIRVPLMKTQGVLKVDANFESHQIIVKGMIDPMIIHKRIEKLSKKKVELISPQVKINANIATKTEIEAKMAVKPEIKETSLWKTKMKVHMHCEKCEHDLKQKLLKHKGIYNVETDMKAQIITIDGTIESEKLVAYLQKKIRKHAEIIPPISEKKEETKQIMKVETKITESTLKVVEPNEGKKVVEVKEKDVEKKKVAEVKEDIEEKKVAEVKENNVPYFIHYVYAPQTFSDENPNACFVM